MALAVAALCKICETRRPRRYCPGVQGDICSICCGTEREVTVKCPLECPYLREAHQHEKLPELDRARPPYEDVRITEEFLAKNEPLLITVGTGLRDAGLETDSIIDEDLREALDAMIRTYRTRQSGLIYETRPTNPLAAGIQGRLQAGIDRYQEELTNQSGMVTLRDADVLGTLVFWLRTATGEQNGRRQCRRFLEVLNRYFAVQEPARII